jgi:hypothetical protein
LFGPDGKLLLFFAFRVNLKALLPFMMTPSEDEGLHVIPPDKPKPRLLQTAISKAERETGEIITRSGIRRLKVLGFLSLSTILCVFGFVYMMERQQRGWIGLRISKAKASFATTSEAVGSAAASSTAIIRNKPVPVTPDMLHVTSIALGEPALAVVNGKSLAKGDSFVVATAAGNATLRVMNIEDGRVQFNYHGQLIEAKLPPELVQ